MNKKGTINLEFMILILCLLTLFLILISISYNEFNAIQETQNRKEARMITSTISHIINNVNVHSEGFSQSYKLPDMINKETYVVQINSTGVYVNSHYQLTYNKFIPTNVYYKDTNNKNMYLKPGNEYQFINKGNRIEIYQIN